VVDVVHHVVVVVQEIRLCRRRSGCDAEGCVVATVTDLGIVESHFMPTLQKARPFGLIIYLYKTA